MVFNIAASLPLGTGRATATSSPYNGVPTHATCAAYGVQVMGAGPASSESTVTHGSGLPGLDLKAEQHPPLSLRRCILRWEMSQPGYHPERSTRVSQPHWALHPRSLFLPAKHLGMWLGSWSYDMGRVQGQHTPGHSEGLFRSPPCFIPFVPSFPLFKQWMGRHPNAPGN